MEARLTADELASDLASAEVLVDKHQEHMVRCRFSNNVLPLSLILRAVIKFQNLSVAWLGRYALDTVDIGQRFF